MNSNAISLTLKAVKSAYKSYSDYRDKKAAELYDAMQEAKKVAATQNEAAKQKASEFAADVADVKDKVTEEVSSLTSELTDKAQEAKKDSAAKTKRAQKKARKVQKDLEVRTQKALDEVTGKKEQRAKNGRIATASVVFAVVAALVGVIVWKLRKSDQLPVDPAPFQQRATEVKEKIADKVEDAADDVAEEEAKLEELELEEADDEGMVDQVAEQEEAAKAAKAAPKAPKPGQSRKK